LKKEGIVVSERRGLHQKKKDFHVQLPRKKGPSAAAEAERRERGGLQGGNIARYIRKNCREGDLRRKEKL